MVGHLILFKIFENCALHTRIRSFEVLENQIVNPKNQPDEGGVSSCF
jgi:hypothetical protein